MCAVLLYHARAGWTPGGFLGVDLFFVLSGYLITSLLLVEHRRLGGIGLARFWAGRVRRLLPAATLVIAVCVIVAAAFYRGELGRVRGDALASILYVNNWHQVIASHSYFAAFGRPSPLQHYWSLAVEEQFYLVWPLVLVAGLAWRRRGWLVTLAVALAAGSGVLMALLYRAGSDPSRVYYGTDTRATPLMVGAILAFGWPMGRLTVTAGRGARPLLDVLGLAGLGALLLLIATWHDYDPFLYRGGFAVAAVAAAALIAAAAHPTSDVAKALAWRPLRWIGQRSYGIYLWHWPVMVFSRPGIDLRWSSWALVPAQIGLTVGLAALSYRYVEMPVRRGQAQRALRGWLDRRRPRARLVWLAGAFTAVVLVAVAVALIPATGSRRHLLASSVASRSLHQRQPSGHPGAGAGRHPATVLAVGASVMLAAEPELEHRLHAQVDAAVGRQPAQIIDRLQAYRSARLLPARVVVQLGDNGPLWHADAVRLRRVLDGVPQVVLVNVREATSWQTEVNRQLAHIVGAWPQARLANWWYASANSALLYDGAHPDRAGAAVYAKLVQRALDRRGRP